jgi:tetratricopeptide (TPR) repeat protein
MIAMKELVQPLELNKLEMLLVNVERRALSAASHDQKARVYNLAGDLCFDAQQPERALKYYEQAINIHISADQHDSAITICKKLVAQTPDTVHMRCTLAWLTAAIGLIAEAKLHIEEYLRAAERAGLARLARKHLLGLAEIASAGEVLEAINDNLTRMGNDVTADWVAGQLDRMQGRMTA